MSDLKETYTDAKRFRKEHREVFPSTHRLRDPVTGRNIYSRGQSVHAKCLDCGRLYVTPRNAWSRVAQPLCRMCGGKLEPVVSAQERDPYLRIANPVKQTSKCVMCDAPLNTRNTTKFCRTCQLKLIRNGVPACDWNRVAQSLHEQKSKKETGNANT